MKNLADAIAFFEYASNNQLFLYKHRIEVKYSIHQHLQRNPLDYTVSHIVLVTICGCDKSPLSLHEMAGVRCSPRRQH